MVTSITPASGPLAGGNTVTIVGTGFDDVTGVRFGNNAGTNFVRTGSTQISVQVPSRGADGPVTVTLMSLYTSTPVANGYTYARPPSIYGVAPYSGPLAGGTSVVISGYSFTGVTDVTFGGTSATSFTVDSDMQITAVSPPGSAGTVDLVVTSPGGSATTNFTYAAPLTITSVSPNSGSSIGNTNVTITGTGFTGATSVYFGSMPARSFIVVSNTQINAVTPSGNGTADVIVNKSSAQAVASSAFTFAASPSAWSINPSSGPGAGGTTVTIGGSNLSGVTAVSFGGTPATSFTVNSSSSITAVTPPGPTGRVDVVLTAPGGTATMYSAFNYAVPGVTMLFPSSGTTAGGASVYVDGNGFTGATAVSFGGTPVLQYTILSDSTIRALTPPGTAGPVSVAVTSSSGNVLTLNNGYTYTPASAPTMRMISPTGGMTTGGTIVTLTGTNFTGVTAVTFGGTAATSFTIDSPTQITAVAPARPAGPASIAVTAPNGTATFSSPFIYSAPPTAAPTVITLPTATGSTAGGYTVDINGSNFFGATAVSFGSTPATSFIVMSSGTIRATVPAGSAGAVDVTVTTPLGTHTRTNGFTYTSTTNPAISGFSPTNGPITGGTSVTITGSGFTGATMVRIAQTQAASFTVDSDTQITAVTGVGSLAGAGPVNVTTPGGSVQATDNFTYTASSIGVPTIASLSPASGAIAGGTSVTINGTNFSGASEVWFGNARASYYLVDSPTQITAITPAGSAGAADVSLIALGGAATSSGAYTYSSQSVPAPTIASVTPSSGAAAGGTSVTITGTGFTGASAVRFGNIAAASYTVDSATQITAVSPAGSAGAVNISVVTSGGTATSNGAFTYTAPLPTITLVTPNTGSTLGSETVVITGTNFTGASAVSIGGAVATFTVNSATQITATTPVGSAGPADIVVTTPGGSATDPGAYIYIVPPTISSISPTSGTVAGGTSVTITGTGLSSVSQVDIGGAPATFTINSATSITVTTPAGSVGSASVAVTSGGGTATLNNAFTYLAGPAVASVTPNTGPAAGGTSVVITGADLTGASAVSFGSTAATSFTVNSATQITAVAPAGTAGAVNVSVVTPAGTATANNAFTYIALPTIASVTPASGPIAGGTSVVITGTGLTGASAVSFGGTAATSFTVNSATQITAIAPAGSAGAVNLTVVTPGGTATSNGAYSYAAPVSAPTIASVSPASGAAAGGASVVITGTNLTGASAVSFGSTAATSFTVNSATQITAVAPAGTAGAVNVSVVTPGGTASLNNGFTYHVAPTAAARTGVAVGFNSQGMAIDLTASVSGMATSLAIATQPAHGTASVNGMVVTYVPVADYYGADSFSYTATGPGGTSAPAQVSLMVAGAAPRIQPQSASTGDGQMVSVELTRGAALGPFTAAQIAGISPANAATARITSTGSGASQRFFLEATPTARFGGTLTIGYTLTNAFGVSPVGTVTIAVTARPDPASDPRVRALSEAQVQATRRFGNSQISNFMRRNEQLHGSQSRSSENLSINIIDPARERRPEMLMAAGDKAALLDTHRNVDEAAMAAAEPAGAAGSEEKSSGLLGSMSVWVSGAIDIATRDASSFAPKLSATTSGLSGGVDFRLSKRSAIGIGGGYGNSVSEFGGKAARMRAISKLVAAYGSSQILDGAFVDAVVGRGSLDYKMRRRIDGTDLTARGNRSGTMNLAALSMGINRQAGDLDWSFYNKLQYIDARLGGYVETGAGARTNLRYAAMDDSLFSAGLGFRVQRRMETGIGQVTPRLRAEAGREIGKAGIQYVDYADILDGNARSIRTPRSERMYYQTSLGAMFELEDDWSIDLEYELMYNNAATSTGVRVQITRPF